MNIRKKPRYPFKLFSALLAENRQKSTYKDEKTSILFTVTRNEKTSILFTVTQLRIPGVTSYNLMYVQNQFYWL